MAEPSEEFKKRILEEVKNLTNKGRHQEALELYKTYFPELNLTVKEEVGKFVIFDPMLYHEVPKYKYTKERVTVAFNCDEHQFLMNSKTTKILK